MHLTIVGYDLPGRTFCRPDGSPLDDVRVGIQVGREPAELVPGDAPGARWDCDVRVVVLDDGALDFRGLAVQGKRGERFVYLTWGNVGVHGFEMFRRAKLMLHRVEPALVRDADASGRALVATVRLTDARGAPRCARVDPPDVVWSVGDDVPPGEP